MFLDFYKLRQQPFGVTPDPAYLYLSRTHREALDSLLSGVQDGRGFLALIADPGMGKTTLLYHLLEQLRGSARTAFLFQTQCDSREFFQYLLGELGVDTRDMDLVTMHSKLNEALFAEMLAGRRFVLVVDESQNLSDAVLETVRLLSNFETSHTKLLQIVLAGQPQLASKLALPQLSQLRQRIAALCRLEPLSVAETSNYIEHRLRVAGYCGGPLFHPDAVALIAKQSQGIPRNINNLCYSALGAAQTRGLEVVTTEIVREVATRLNVAPAEERRPETLVRPVESIPSQTTPREVKAKAAVARLTYDPVKLFRLPRWSARALVLIGVFALASVSLTAVILRFTEPGPAKAAAVSVPRSSSPPPTYSAAPQETDTAQVITVVLMPHQTLEELSLEYVGRFDSELLQEIRALNPELRNLEHPTAGQLIRLPLPRGSFRKGKDLTSEQ